MTKYAKAEIRTMLIEAAKLFDLIHAHMRATYNAAYWSMEDDGVNLDEMTVVVYKEDNRYGTTVNIDDLVGAL